MDLKTRFAPIAEDAAARGAPDPYPAWPIAWFCMFVFCQAQILQTMDRGVLTLVVDPVAHDIGASEVQMGVLQGIAIAVFYVLVGVPLGLIADRVSRRRLLMLGMTVWSLATLLGGLAHDFRSLLACRLLVGMGEATLGPCAVSMISDLFPPSRRSSPMALYMLFGAISSGVAYMFTGAVLGLARTGALDRFGFLHGLAPWRIAFMACGAVGSITLAFLFLLREPPRTGASLGERRGLGIAGAAAYFGSNWSIFAPFYGGIGVASMGVGGASWGVVYIGRHFKMTASQIGQQLGLLNIAAACVSSLLAWLLVNAVVRRAGLRGKLAMAPFTPLIALPCALVVLAPTPFTAMACLAASMLEFSIFGAVMLSCTVELAPANMRGVAISLYALAVILLGGGLGPLAVALITQYGFKDPAMVGWSLLIVSAPTLLGGSALMAICRRNALAALQGVNSFRTVFEAVKG
jgi:MFS family permease